MIRKKRITNYVGMSFGWITVISLIGKNEKNQSLYLCRCQCGNEFTEPSSNIRRMNSCYECRNKRRSIEQNKKYIGKKFYLLTILDLYFKTTKNGHNSLYCKAICECGKETEGAFSNILHGHKKSCGCLNNTPRYYELLGLTRGGNFLPSGESGFNLLYISYLNGAKRRNLPFEISKDEFIKLSKLNCYYCGIKPLQIKRSTAHKNHHGDFIYNGIDRIDSSIGYIKENVVPCCKDCNTAKMQMSQQEFYDWIDRVYNHIHKKESNE